MDPEWIHNRVIEAGRMVSALGFAVRPLARLFRFCDPRLETQVCGLRFANPLGLAAGFDKSGYAIRGLEALGFGHLEIGSVSADPSAGNPRPRLWRLPQDQAILVHYGLPNDGADAVASRLERVSRSVPLGVNIVKTNRGLDAPPEDDDAIIADYVYSVRAIQRHADFLHLNLSCPNTETGRDFFADSAHLSRLFSALGELEIRCPVFLKISPLGGIAAIEALLAAADGVRFISGFAYNLAPGKPTDLKTPRSAIEHLPGAVSGKPIENQMNEAIGELYRRMDRKRYRIIGIGGVFTAEDAYRKIRLGASLVQLMTALIYEGPAVVRRINEGLCRLLERDGFRNVEEAVGTGNTGSS